MRAAAGGAQKMGGVPAKMTYGAARHRKTDANCSLIVKTLRKLGCRVHVTNDDWDLTVQRGGITMLCEVRGAGKPRKARKGRQADFQSEFMVYWLQTQEDCQNLAKTLIRWSEAVMNGSRTP